jgi:hypothetical protein
MACARPAIQPLSASRAPVAEPAAAPSLSVGPRCAPPCAWGPATRHTPPQPPVGSAHCPNLTTVVGKAALGAGHDLERIGSEMQIVTPRDHLLPSFGHL